VAAPESTKFQVNFKTPDGTLINLYATSKEELEGLLTAASDFSALIVSTSQAYASAAPAAPVYASAPAVAYLLAEKKQSQINTATLGYTTAQAHQSVLVARWS
jgi:hypothetical protein